MRCFGQNRALQRLGPLWPVRDRVDAGANGRDERRAVLFAAAGDQPRLGACRCRKHHCAAGRRGRIGAPVPATSPFDECVERRRRLTLWHLAGAACGERDGGNQREPARTSGIVFQQNEVRVTVSECAVSKGSACATGVASDDAALINRAHDRRSG